MMTDQKDKLIWSFSVATQWAVNVSQMPLVWISDAVWYPKPDESDAEIQMVGFAEYFINKLKKQNIGMDYKLTLNKQEQQLLFSIKIDETRWMPR